MIGGLLGGGSKEEKDVVKTTRAEKYFYPILPNAKQTGSCVLVELGAPTSEKLERATKKDQERQMRRKIKSRLQKS